MTASLDTLLKFAVPLAFVVSFALRWIYLRVVRRSMLRPSVRMAAPGDATLPASLTPMPPPAPPSQRLEIVSAAPPQDLRSRCLARPMDRRCRARCGRPGLRPGPDVAMGMADRQRLLAGRRPAVHAVFRVAAGHRGRPCRDCDLARHGRRCAHLRRAVPRCCCRARSEVGALPGSRSRRLGGVSTATARCWCWRSWRAPSRRWGPSWSR